MSQAAVRTGPKTNKNHGNWRPTANIAETLTKRFPGLEFPYLEQDHTHGVNSSVHCYCPEHETFTRIALNGAIYERTKYACSVCANNAGMDLRKANGFSTKQYIGKPGVQSGIFRAVKAVFPDAIWEHRMKCGREIDIWVPSTNAGIEYNGNFYHSTARQSDVKYHAKKSMLAYKEGKYILHVFTDEAVAPYTNLIRMLQMAGGSFDYVPNSRDSFSVCDRDQALSFYSEWSFIHPKMVSDLCNLHVGLFRRGSLVALISGIRESRKVLRTSSRLYGVPMDKMLSVFQAAVGRLCTIYADLRNPLEVGMWSGSCKLVDYTMPIGFTLDKDYNILYENSSDCSDYRIYDCGHMIFKL
jgi:hypothetical protein